MFFTPVAFLWLVVGYFLQKEELSLQNKELGLQREELKEGRKALGSQVKIMEKRAEAERRQSMPNLSLEEISRESGPSGSKSKFALKNFGAPAHRLDLIHHNALSIREGKHMSQLKTDASRMFSIADTSSSTDHAIHHYTVRFSSERRERFEQSWTITFTGDGHPPFIEPTTDEPTLVEDH